MKRFTWLLIGLVILGVILVLLFVSRSDYDTLQADFEALELQSSSLSSQLQQAQSGLTGLQSDLSQLQADYDDVNQELEDLKNAPPARYFSSVTELENWLLLNGVSEQPWTTTPEVLYAKGLQVQEDALKDGYIISVQYHFCDERQVIEYIACVAVIDGYLWFWNPETDDPHRHYILGKVK